jgi:hypothetical protein
MEHGELTNRTVCEGWSKSCVHELNELVPCWPPSVQLHSMKPQLGVIEQVERSEGDSLVFRRAAHMKELFVVVEPRRGVAGAVELWELQLVRHGDHLAGLGPFIRVALPWPRLGRWPCGALRVGHRSDNRVQGLLLGGLLLDRGLKHGHLVLQWRQGLHLDFYGVKATKDGIERRLDGGCGTLDGLCTQCGGRS